MKEWAQKLELWQEDEGSARISRNDTGISLDCGGEDVGAAEQQQPKKEHKGKGMREES